MCCRVLPVAARLLPGVDLPGRVVLHGQHHAPVHHQRRQVPQSAVSHEVRTQQDEKKSHAQDSVRVAAVNRYEPAAQPYVLASEF